MSFETLLVTKDDGVGIVTLNRPAKLNAINPEMMDELIAVSAELAGDDAVRAVVLTGAGRAFSAGGDLASQLVRPPTDDAALAQGITNVKRLLLTFTGMAKPTIAAVNGLAVGAACNLALACDMIFASDKASFTMGFIKIALVPDMAGVYFLPRRVGVAKACELIMTGRTIDAPEAEKIGLVNHVVPHDQFETTVLDFARGLAKGPTVAIAQAKTAIYEAATMDLESAIELEIAKQMPCLESQDFKEAINAFLEKRQPVFVGR